SVLPHLGRDDAPVAIVEFSDFECPYCAQYVRGLYQNIRKEFVDSGKVRYAFADFPLSSHRFAMAAGEAAWCAGRQGKFWAMHDALFENQERLSSFDYKTQAGLIGVNENDFDACMRGNPSTDVLKARSEGSRIGVNSTPTFLLGQVAKDSVVRSGVLIRGA